MTRTVSGFSCDVLILNFCLSRVPVCHVCRHQAAQYGQVAAMNMLLDHGADIAAHTTGDYAPLHVAGLSSHVAGWLSNREVSPSVSRLAPLLHRFARPRPQPQPEHLYVCLFLFVLGAAEKDMWAACDLLVERGANIESKTTHGRTALHCAAAQGRSLACDALIKKGADVNARDGEGRTPLILAARYGHLDAVKAILKGKPNTKATDKHSHTAIDAARHAPGAAAKVAGAIEDAIVDHEMDVEDGII